MVANHQLKIFALLLTTSSGFAADRVAIVTVIAEIAETSTHFERIELTAEDSEGVLDVFAPEKNFSIQRWDGDEILVNIINRSSGKLRFTYIKTNNGLELLFHPLKQRTKAEPNFMIQILVPRAKFRELKASEPMSCGDVFKT